MTKPLPHAKKPTLMRMSVAVLFLVSNFFQNPLLAQPSLQPLPWITAQSNFGREANRGGAPGSEVSQRRRPSRMPSQGNKGEQKPLKDYSAAATEAGVLPAGYFRLRLLQKNLSGKTGFAADGSADSPGIGVAVSASAVVIDAGVANDITLAIGIPYIHANKANFDGDAFAASRFFAGIYAKYEKDFIRKLMQQGFCANEEACHTRIERGDSLPTHVSFRVPSSNENVVIPAFMPIKQALTSLITHAAKQDSGARGVGDIEAGLRYRFKRFTESAPVQAAATFSLLFPTGAYSNVPLAQRAVGRGVTEGSLALSGDWKLHSSLVLSGTLGTGMALSTGRRKRSGVRMNNTTVQGTCDSNGTGNNTDSLCQPLSPSQSIERQGLFYRMLLQGSFAAGQIAPSFKLLALTAGIRSEKDSVEIIDSEAQPAKSLLSAHGILSLDGLTLSPIVPLQLDLEFSKPVAGVNQPVALNSLTTTLKLFF